MKPLTANELLVMDRPTLVRYMPPLVEEKVLGMIHAWRGVGKTHFILELACALCSGARFLKWECLQPAKVLFIDTEMTSERMADRLLKIAQGCKYEFCGDNLGFYSADMFPSSKIPDISEPEGANWLLRTAKLYDVIIIDNLSGIAVLSKDSDEKTWARIEPIFMKLRAMGKCVIMIHHSNKSGTQSGTSKKESPLDWVIQLKRPADYSADEGARFDITFEKTRNFYGAWAEDISAMMMFDDEGKRTWQWESKSNSLEDIVRKMKKFGMSAQQISKDTGTPLFRVKVMLKQINDEFEMNKPKPEDKRSGIEFTIPAEREADDQF